MLAERLKNAHVALAYLGCLIVKVALNSRSSAGVSELGKNLYLSRFSGRGADFLPLKGITALFFIIELLSHFLMQGLAHLVITIPSPTLSTYRYC